MTPRRIDVDNYSRMQPRARRLNQMDPEVVFWPSGFLEAWGTETKQPHTFRRFFGLAAEGGKANKTTHLGIHLIEDPLPSEGGLLATWTADKTFAGQDLRLWGSGLCFPSRRPGQFGAGSWLRPKSARTGAPKCPTNVLSARPHESHGPGQRNLLRRGPDLKLQKGPPFV